MKAANTLARRFNGVVIVAGMNLLSDVELLEGDANGDNFVSIEDFLVLSTAFSALQDDPNYDAATDFDANGEVNIVDYSFLANNFGIAGE